MWGRLGLLVVMLVLGASSVLAQEASRFIQTGEQVGGPHGWYDFCKRTKRLQDRACAVQGEALPKLANFPELHLEIEMLQEFFYRKYRHMDDLLLHGVEEHWTYLMEGPNGGGDCEDFVLSKRRALLSFGIPSSVLLIAVVLAWSNHKREFEGHAVLVVRTEHGDLVLDSFRPDVHWWWESQHRFLAMQSQLSPNNWVRVVEPPAPTTTIGQSVPRNHQSWKDKIFQPNN